MIEYAHGDIFLANTLALVNPTNCQGISGAGLAREFAHKFPGMNKQYRMACKEKLIRLGEVWGYMTDKDSPMFVINFPTKRYPSDRSPLGSIRDGLLSLLCFLRGHNIGSVAIPRLGCGLGGLDWHDVRPLIVDTFRNDPDIAVRVYGSPPVEEGYDRTID